MVFLDKICSISCTTPASFHLTEYGFVQLFRFVVVHILKIPVFTQKGVYPVQNTRQTPFYEILTFCLQFAWSEGVRHDLFKGIDLEIIGCAKDNLQILVAEFKHNLTANSTRCAVG